MIAVECEKSQECRFILCPNRSLTWRGTVLFFMSLVVVSGIIAVPLTNMGFWLVLPFAGLELLLVGIGLYQVACRCYEREVIHVGQTTIHIERGRRYPQQRCTVGRPWAKVVLERCPRRWYPSRLVIRSHGRAIEIGRFLNEEERQQLAIELTRSLQPALSHSSSC